MAQQQLDKLDRKILRIISRNARTPFLEVARECKVSGAAVHQRVQKLQQSGVLLGSEFIINNSMVGFQTCAYVGITLSDAGNFDEVVKHLLDVPEVVECHCTTGKYAMFIKIYAHDNHHLLQILVDRISKIPNVTHTETFLISLDEMIHRQVTVSE